MESNYGTQMGKAIRAILDMHDDCIRLFRDLDKAFPAYISLYGNIVTLDQSSSINRRRYLAQGLIRLYARTGSEEQVLGVNICFYDGAKLEEPIFVAANTRYRQNPRDSKEKVAPVRGHATLHRVINAERGTKPARSSDLSTSASRATFGTLNVSLSPRALSWPCCDRKLPSGEILVLAQPGERLSGLVSSGPPNPPVTL